ncbi:MAG: T9SS type A sorting domain-containing protein [Bacteroidales bacterium]|jgi:hypothetical protein|nr:T9SS type A sorting domain-containing protein [Bacteroidales bacterium]
MRKIIYLMIFTNIFVWLYANCERLTAQNIKYEYIYDNAGNRIQRGIIAITTSANNSQLTDTTILSEEKIVNIVDKITITVYPNPVKENLNIELSEYNENSYYELLDVNNKIIEKRKIVSNFIAINFETISPGIYILRVYPAKDSKEYKIIKSH